MRRFLMLMLFASTLPAFIGCQEREGVAKTEVTYEERQPLRQRVAVIRPEKGTFYIKVLGPSELVKQNEEAFEKFVRSAKIDLKKKEEPITFEEPKGWRKDPVATPKRMGYRIDAKPKELEISVLFMDEPQFSLIDNIRRWQKFVHIPIAEDEEQARQFIKREKVGEHEVIWVAMDGLGVHTVSKPPEKATTHSQKFDPSIFMKKKGHKEDDDEGGGGNSPFDYKLPAGWKDSGNLNNITLGRWAVESAEVTLSRAMGELAPNVNRWRGQVKLEPVSAAEIERDAARRKVGRVEARYIDIQNPAGPAGANRMLVVMIPGQPESWFIKMTGSIEVVGKHKQEFEAFVDSFKK